MSEKCVKGKSKTSATGLKYAGRVSKLELMSVRTY